jgi:hypothetical protein
VIFRVVFADPGDLLIHVRQTTDQLALKDQIAEEAGNHKDQQYSCK